jgi:hypothetical protein
MLYALPTFKMSLDALGLLRLGSCNHSGLIAKLLHSVIAVFVYAFTAA